MFNQRAQVLGVHAILIAYSALAIGPILLVVMNSFKARNAIFGAPLAPPNATTFSLIGYAKVFKASLIGTYFANSLIVTLVSMGLVLLFGAMAAWALTEYKFRGSTALALFLSIGIKHHHNRDHQHGDDAVGIEHVGSSRTFAVRKSRSFPDELPGDLPPNFGRRGENVRECRRAIAVAGSFAFVYPYVLHQLQYDELLARSHGRWLRLRWYRSDRYPDPA